jgi:hypothetical protein
MHQHKVSCSVHSDTSEHSDARLVTSDGFVIPFHRFILRFFSDDRRLADHEFELYISTQWRDAQVSSCTSSPLFCTADSFCHRQTPFLLSLTPRPSTWYSVPSTTRATKMRTRICPAHCLQHPYQHCSYTRQDQAFLRVQTRYPFSVRPARPRPEGSSSVHLERLDEVQRQTFEHSQQRIWMDNTPQNKRLQHSHLLPRRCIRRSVRSDLRPGGGCHEEAFPQAAKRLSQVLGRHAWNLIHPSLPMTPRLQDYRSVQQSGEATRLLTSASSLGSTAVTKLHCSAGCSGRIWSYSTLRERLLPLRSHRHQEDYTPCPLQRSPAGVAQREDPDPHLRAFVPVLSLPPTTLTLCLPVTTLTWCVWGGMNSTTLLSMNEEDGGDGEDGVCNNSPAE